MTQEQIYEIIQKKAATDKGFREKLLKDPNAAISEASGVKVPSDFKIKVLEKDPAYNATFVLPNLLSEEIGDDALDKVAGGICGANKEC